MRKPVHAFAALLWLAAVAYLIADPIMIALVEPQFLSPGTGRLEVLRFAWLIRSELLDACFVASMGFVVELLDQLRWLATPVDERAATRGRYLLERFRRSRVS